MNQQQKELNITFDAKIHIATGKSRKETKWKNQEIAWSQLVEKLAYTTRTRETMAQYNAMTKDQRSAIKDVGGFVGGVVKGGRRKAGNVQERSLITLDADFAEFNPWANIQILFGNAAVIYSTHSHTPKRPKLRVVMPLARKVTAEEYEALSRFIAYKIDIEIFDDTTYQPERLMYWPSTADGAEYIFEYQDGPFLDPDLILEEYPHRS